MNVAQAVGATLASLGVDNARVLALGDPSEAGQMGHTAEQGLSRAIAQMRPITHLIGRTTGSIRS